MKKFANFVMFGVQRIPLRGNKVKRAAEMLKRKSLSIKDKLNIPHVARPTLPTGPAKHAMDKLALTGLGKFNEALVNRMDAIKNIPNPTRQKLINIKTLIQSNKIFKHLKKK